MKNSLLVLDTPIVMHHGNCQFDEFAVPGYISFSNFICFCIFHFCSFSCSVLFVILFPYPDHVVIMNKRAKTEAPTNQRNKQGTKLFQDASVVKELSVHPKVSNHYFCVCNI